MVSNSNAKTKGDLSLTFLFMIILIIVIAAVIGMILFKGSDFLTIIGSKINVVVKTP